MKTTALAALIVSILNNAAQEIETAISESGEDEGEETRAGEGKDNESKGAKGKGAKGKSKEDDDGDAPSESDIVEAVRAALKVLEKKEVSKIIKKHGKADRATEVDEELRQKVIDALEKAVEDAEEAE
jgi:hypothetical protein